MEKETAASSILAWAILMDGGAWRLQSMGSGVRHDWDACMHVHNNHVFSWSDSLFSETYSYVYIEKTEATYP